VFFPDEEAAAPAKSAPGQVASQAAADD
jgi:hypothetical protein